MKSNSSNTTISDLMPKGELSPSSNLLPANGGRQARLRQTLIVVLFIIGLIVCVTSLLCILLLPTFVTNQISKRLVLKNNSLLLERWSKPNVPMYFKVWVFDVKNAQEVIDKRGTKPQLKEIGPFVFHLKRQKDIVSFAGENLYYTERKLYHFSPELSCCAMNTTVTIPNIPLVAVVDRALSYNLPLVGRFIPRLINRAIQSLREQLFVRKQVREILFDGYEVELLKMVSRVGSLVGMPQTNQKFAILKGRNDSWRPEQDGVWAINTGARDRRLFGKVSSWNSYRQLPFWAAPSCNTINGSDGTLFPPPIKRTEPLYIFNQELCRTVNLVYDRQSDIRAIRAYRFVLNPLNFAHTVSPISNTITTSATSQQQHQRRPLQLETLEVGGARSAPAGTLSASSGINPPRVPMPTIASTARMVHPHPQAHHQQQQQQHHYQPVTSSRHIDLKPMASETRASTPSNAAAAPSAADVGVAAAAAAAAANKQRWRSRQVGGDQAPVMANGSGSGLGVQQAEKLVLAAQEAQAQSDRRAQSPINPFTCFCDRKTTNLNGLNVCELDGLIDLSKCTKQAQVIFGSMPHFYQSDPRLLRQVVGMEPNASKHTTYLDIEPNTGLVLGGKRRVQLNLIIKHNNEVEGFENINDMLVPLVWFEESALIPEEAANKFKSLYTDRVRLVNIVLSALFLAAIGLLAIDARLLASQYSHCFHFNINCKPKKGGVSGGFSDQRGEEKEAAIDDGKGNALSLIGNKSRRARNLRSGLSGSKPPLMAAAIANNTVTDNNLLMSDDTDEDYTTKNRAVGGLNLPLLGPPAGLVTTRGQAGGLSYAANGQPDARNNSLGDNNNKEVSQFVVQYNDTLSPTATDDDHHYARVNGDQAATARARTGGDNMPVIEIGGHTHQNQPSKSEMLHETRLPTTTGGGADRLLQAQESEKQKLGQKSTLDIRTTTSSHTSTTTLN